MPPKRTRELLEGSYSRPSGSSSSSRGAQPPPNAPPSANRAQDASPRKRVKKEPEEKRLRRERKIPNIGITERIKRATTQRLFLIDRTMEGPYHEEYRVLGSTGNVYVVDIQQIPSCNCPDHLKGNLCKHILFVMLKVLRCPPDDHRIYQSALLTKELADLFERGRQISSAILANASVRKAVTGSSDDDTPQRRDVSEDDTCQICFEDFDAKEFESGALDYCRAQCGKNFHKECLKMWKSQCLRDHKSVTCANCRAVWVEEGAPNKANGTRVNEEGYVNLGKLQGLPEERDEGTYRDRYRDREWW